ncbi:MAG: hypothetical protein JWP65_2167 [Ramlibacter sp.]|jgi:hypothetical protein|uniref:hypothetical protein n=1 Tax=Ramlibacter sp. TaxID=1917967 RepID=UPI0026262404|nr:hypothetical protein [Ramlibacter sp.]MDB5751746.1 hypothetical protein [Ramlibacter sp.]
MGLLGDSLMRWLGGAASTRPPVRSRSGPNSTQFVASQATSPAKGHAERKELLKAAMRDLLERNRIPEGWLSADLLRTTSVKREQGIHVRLLVRHWDPRLTLHGVALEQDFFERLVALDPTAPQWLMGFSWQFNLPDPSVCPELPDPASWTAVVAPQPEPQGPPTTRAGGIIEGPAYIPPAQEDVRADLERLLALRDDDLKRHGPGEDGFAATRPVGI